MPRVKGGMIHTKHRRNILKHTKGFNWGRKSKVKLAKTAAKKAGQYAFNDRRRKKRTNRQLWSVKINTASRELGMNYSKLISKLKKQGININRKMLAELAEKHPAIFAKLVE